MYRRLGEVLVFEQVITERQLEWALERQGKLAAPLGRILISNKLCTRLQLLRCLRLQVAEAGPGEWPRLLLQIVRVASYDLFRRSRPPPRLSKQALIDLRQAMEAAPSLSAVCDTIHAYVRQHLQAEGCAVQLREGDVLEAVGARGCAWGLDWTERLDGSGLSAHCFRAGLPVSTAQLDPGVARAPEFHMMGGPAAALALPVSHRGTLVGVLTMLAKPKGHLAQLTTQEVNLLSMTVGGELYRRSMGERMAAALVTATSAGPAGSPELQF